MVSLLRQKGTRKLIFRYQDTSDLLASILEHIIDPAEQKAKELLTRNILF